MASSNNNTDETTFSNSLQTSFQEITQGIYEDDVDSVSSLIHCSPSLLNSLIKDKDVPMTERFTPLALAISLGAENVTLWLIENKADINFLNEKNNNIIHMLVESAEAEPKNETKLCDILKTIAFTIRDEEYPKFRELFFQQNNEGLRPLELAFKKHTYDVCETILEMDGIYRKEVPGSRRCLSVKYQFSLIEDYDSRGKRVDTSPLEFLRYTKTKHLEKLHKSDLLNSLVLKLWIKDFRQKSRGYLICWMLIRFIFLISVFAESYYWALMFTQPSDFSKMIWLRYETVRIVIFGLLHFLLILYYLHKFGNWVLNYRHRKKLYGDALFIDLVCATSFYQCFTFLFHFLPVVIGYFILGHIINDKLNLPTLLAVVNLNSNITLAHAAGTGITESLVTLGDATMTMVSLYQFCAVWSFAYFIELCPKFGYFLYGLRRSLEALFSFAAAFVILFVSFFLLFRPVLCEFQSHSNNAAIAVSNCTMPKTIYSVFLLSISMIELPENEGMDDYRFMIIHVFFVFLVIFSLLNFLIAFLAETFSKRSRSRSTIQTLLLLDAALSLMHFWRAVRRGNSCESCRKRVVKELEITVPISSKLFSTKTKISQNKLKWSRENLSMDDAGLSPVSIITQI